MLPCAPVRPPVDTIAAPPFPKDLPWINVAPLRMDQQIGRPVLVEFWDFCRVNSLRTLPYVAGWHERYADAGLRVIGVHAAGFPPSGNADAVREAVARLGIVHPVVVDVSFGIWDFYGNAGWPARYLWDQQGMLFDVHIGEGGYVETELAIQELLGVTLDPLAAVRPEDEPDAEIAIQTADQDGDYRGPYEAGGVWAVLSGRGSVTAFGHTFEVTYPGAYPLVEHERHTVGVVDLELGPKVRCHGVCFVPGVV